MLKILVCIPTTHGSHCACPSPVALRLTFVVQVSDGEQWGSRNEEHVNKRTSGHFRLAKGLGGQQQDDPALRHVALLPADQFVHRVHSLCE